ncbi:MAG TPA: hypothetical protein VF808_10020 [Ktedonobacterales bacterium]
MAVGKPDTADARDSGETLVALAVGPAFAWLADPRNAGAWFAAVRLERPPAPPLRAGCAWRFLLTRQRDRPMPMRLSEYTPSTRFVWETDYPGWRGNLRWVLTLAPGAASGDVAAATRLGLRIEQRPGLVGWPLLGIAWLAERVSRETASGVRARAQRAVERARDALESAPPTAFTVYGYGPARGGRGKRR